jgi:hypothetical protein
MGSARVRTARHRKAKDYQEGKEMRKFHLVGLVAVVAAIGALVLVPATASAAPQKPKAALSQDPVPITGTASDGSTFAGSFDISRFARQDGQLVAIGDLTGALTGTTNQPVDVANLAVPITAPGAQGAAAAAAAGPSCQILDLVLGPLHLDLLGLVVDLNQVHLQITGQQGPGNLLGNLLCGVAGLLDPSSPNNANVAQILNRLLGL